MNCSIRRVFLAAGWRAARLVGPKDTAFGGIDPSRKQPSRPRPSMSTWSKRSRPQRKSSSKEPPEAFSGAHQNSSSYMFLHWIPNSELSQGKTND
jgi:hypothetical protein